MVLTEGDGHGAQARHRETCGQPHGECRLQRRVAEQLVDERRPVLLEVDARLDGFEHPEAGRQPEVEGMLAQQARREAVQRRERRVVELVERTAAPGPSLLRVLAAVAGRHDVLESGADWAAQLRRSGLGERDRGEVAQLDVAGDHECHDPVHEHGGLPGSGTSLDEQVRVVVVADAPPRLLVAHRAHSVSARLS